MLDRGTRLARTIASLLRVIAFALASAAAAGEPSNARIETIDVIATPLGGSRIDDALARGDAASADDIARQGAQDVAAYLKGAVASVATVETQGNPFQPDLELRGFVGSALLGLPQGIAVFQDAVRINEPFGDTVNWSTIPDAAIERVRVLPGANALFGRNALGGAIVVDTKSGFAADGTQIDLSGGAFGRREVSGASGGTVGDALGYFVAGSDLREDGWRDRSPSDLRQLFGKLSGRAGDASTIDLSVTRVDTELTGNGASPETLLATDRDAVFTYPDRTAQRATLVAVKATHAFDADTRATMEAHVRESDIHSLNGDVSDYFACTAAPGLICQGENGDEQPIADAAGAPVPVDPALLGATLNRTRIDQQSGGASFEIRRIGSIAGRGAEALAGVAYDASSTSYGSDTELGTLNAGRGAIGGGVLVGDAFTRLDADASVRSAFVAAAVQASRSISLTASARYDSTELDLDDRLGTALDGKHQFSHVNPSLDASYTVRPALSLYASWGESSRAPSPVELGCADADAPCRLPNAFVADPDLKQVVASTFEAGARATWRDVDLRAAAYTTTNHDDILFVSAGAATNEGFFTNVGRTRRDGFELVAETAAESEARVRWFANVSAIDATFERDFVVSSPNHPDSVDGEIQVHSGDQIPLVPAWLAKAGVTVNATEALSIGASALASAGAHLRGDEANLARKTDDYCVFDLHARWALARHAAVWARIENVFDTRYETFGTFGDTHGLVAGPQAQRFMTPSAPRGAWVGVDLAW